MVVLKANENALLIGELRNFNVTQIFDCGQCFRFDMREDGAFEGVAHGKLLRLRQLSPDSVQLEGSPDAFADVWQHYLALDADYSAVKTDVLSHFGGDSVMRAAVEYGEGIRILRQDAWETLCSFIISQNNNIPRIKGLIAALSRAYGDPFEAEGKTFYAFPSPKALADAGEEAIFALKTGFRAKYIYDAATKVADGELDLAAAAAATSDKAAELLMSVKGVGPKVAACTLLFGLGKTDAFPVDVWIKRVLAKYYPQGLDISSLGDYAGVAQQYLFYYERWHGGN